MMTRRWYWSSSAGVPGARVHLRRLRHRMLTLCLVVVAAWLAPADLDAQSDDLEAFCSSAVATSECRVAAAAVRLIQPRAGLGLWGGSPVPGSASTLGMRLGSMPRISMTGRITVVPMELPPLIDRTRSQGERATATALSGQASTGLLPGWSPFPTVGGVLSVDAIGRASWLLLPDDVGFDDGSVLGASVGLRIGILRESFTLPGVSLTASYGRSTGFAFGDPDGTGDGFIDGSVGNWNATTAVTKRFGPVGLTAGAAFDRYTSDVSFDFPGVLSRAEGVDAATDRLAAFVNASWTFLILHGSLEAGWQEAPVPEGVPSSIDLDPAGWWLAAALRLSI